MEMICAGWNLNKTKCGSILFNVLKGEISHHSHTFSFLYLTNRFIALDMSFKFSVTTISMTYMMTWLDATSVTNGTISDVCGWSHHHGFPMSGFKITTRIFLHINIYFKLWYILYTTLLLLLLSSSIAFISTLEHLRSIELPSSPIIPTI